MELCKSHSDAGNTYALFVYAWALMFAGQPKPAIATMNKAANRLFPPATIDLIAFVWSTVGKEHRRAELATKMLGLASRSGHKSALLWRCALERSGCFGIGRRLLGIALTPIAFFKAVSATLFGRPFSAEVFTFPKSLNGPLIRAEAKFSLYNDLAETPVLDERRTFHRYLLAFVHVGVAMAAISGGHILRRPGAESLNGWILGGLTFPFLASATYSVRVVSYQRIRLVLFVLLLGAGALLTGSFVAGAISSVDSVTAFIDIVGVELAAFIWAAEFLLDAPCRRGAGTQCLLVCAVSRMIAIHTRSVRASQMRNGPGGRANTYSDLV
jgi:hypothetical protein